MAVAKCVVAEKAACTPRLMNIGLLTAQLHLATSRQSFFGMEYCLKVKVKS